MEYSCNNYKCKRGCIYTTSDGYKYSKIKTYDNLTFLRWFLYRKLNRCKGSAKLNAISNIIEPKHHHNHSISEYHTELYEVKAKCKSAARTSRERLSKVFKDTTRNEAVASLLSYKNIETTMYRARREIEPTIQRSSAEFCQQIQSTQYAVYYRGEVTVGLEIGVIFYSDKFSQVLTEVEDIQFDGTFYTVPMQYYQLWTLFARIGQHVVPCIHCILTSKQEALYTALITRIHELLPQLLPTHGMSDWEIGPRNAVKKVFHGIHLHGCYFHFAQSVWRKLGKQGLVNPYYNNQEFKQLARAYMSLPFLPEELIPTTFDFLDTHSLVVQEDNTRFRN